MHINWALYQVKFFEKSKQLCYRCHKNGYYSNTRNAPEAVKNCFGCHHLAYIARNFSNISGNILIVSSKVMLKSDGRVDCVN